MLHLQDKINVRDWTSLYQVDFFNSYFLVRVHVKVLSYRCLAPVIKLAAQAVISTCSKSTNDSGDPEDDDILAELEGRERDEISIIRTICVEVRKVLCTTFRF